MIGIHDRGTKVNIKKKMMTVQSAVNARYASGGCGRAERGI
jgi:hypothetical protein